MLNIRHSLDDYENDLLHDMISAVSCLSARHACSVLARSIFTPD